ncbi:minichromosome maintenance protein MCM [Candidatus Woesearchaeota archaeon]|nr:minichromosome maintenance protein MCM [Candidatus Woesearchaeota archaeon]
MDVSTQIKEFQDFFEKNYLDKILDAFQKGRSFIVVDFSLLSKFNIEIAESLLDNPEEVIKAAEIAVEHFDIPEGLKNFSVRLRNLPETQKLMVRDIRSKHINKLIFTHGVVRQKSDVRPQVTSARFECPSCGQTISVLQLDTKFKEPSRCSCGRKGKFRLLSKELVDAQGLVIEETSEELIGGEQPKRMNVFLKNDLVTPMSEKKTNPGTKIKLYGTIKEVPIQLRDGGQSIRFDLIIDANYIETVEEDFSEISISEEEEKQIKELAADPDLMKKLVNSVAPSIFGHEKVKEALLLQLVGGLQKVHDDGIITRGDIHVLLIGDPGAGKSQLLKRITVVAPKARYVGGKGVSGAGLTAAVVRDEFLKGWALEAGALVLANKGICCIDEMDKMNPDDRAAMHEALEQQSVSISKANIQATLRAETTVLAAANPKFGRFDPYETISRQIDLPPTLINRFDLIFPIRDLPDSTKDTQMAEFILNIHQNPTGKKPEIETRLLKKYISYGRQRILPKLSDSALSELKDYYVQMRSSGSTEGEIKTIPISARQLEALIRLAEASAKLRLAAKVTKKDAKKAIELLQYCLGEVGMDKETGKIDIDRISTGIPASERSKIGQIREIIAGLEGTLGKTIPIDDIMREASDRGIKDEDVEEAIEKLKRTGDLFEPKSGFISRI